MKLMIDTNIFIDVLGQREPFFEHSRSVLSLCEEKKIDGFISASSVTDLFYLTRRIFHDTNLSYKAIGAVLDIVKVLTVTNDDVLSAFLQKASDFEDCLLATCAKSNHCNGIITRNKKDFTTFDIDLFSPEEIISLIN